MTLKEFVSETLLQINDGVAEAKGKNPKVAPKVVHHTGHETPVIHASAENPRAFIVEFDVAVTCPRPGIHERKAESPSMS